MVVCGERAFPGGRTFCTSLLRLPNLLWHKLGLAIGAVVAPIVMALMFYGVFTPLAALLRLMGKDLLRLQFDRRAETYWIARDTADRSERTMRNQF